LAGSHREPTDNRTIASLDDDASLRQASAPLAVGVVNGLFTFDGPVVFERNSLAGAFTFTRFIGIGKGTFDAIMELLDCDGKIWATEAYIVTNRIWLDPGVIGHGSVPATVHACSINQVGIFFRGIVERNDTIGCRPCMGTLFRSVTLPNVRAVHPRPFAREGSTTTKTAATAASMTWSEARH